MNKPALILPLLGALALVACETGDVVTGRAVVMRHTPPPAAPRHMAPPPALRPVPRPVVQPVVPAPRPVVHQAAVIQPAPVQAVRPVPPPRPAATMTTRPVVRQAPAPRPQQGATCPVTGKKLYPVMPGQNRGLKLR